MPSALVEACVRILPSLSARTTLLPSMGSPVAEHSTSPYILVGLRNQYARNSNNPASIAMESDNPRNQAEARGVAVGSGTGVVVGVEIGVEVAGGAAVP